MWNFWDLWDLGPHPLLGVVDLEQLRPQSGAEQPGIVPGGDGLGEEITGIPEKDPAPGAGRETWEIPKVWGENWENPKDLGGKWGNPKDLGFINKKIPKIWGQDRENPEDLG